MPKDILGGGLVDFEFEILQFALMQVRVIHSYLVNYKSEKVKFFWADSE